MAVSSSSTGAGPVNPLSPPHDWAALLPNVVQATGGFWFWQVSPTGDYLTDTETGTALAERALQVQAATRFPHLLAWILADMLDAERSGIEIGFLSVIARRCYLSEAIKGLAA